MNIVNLTPHALNLMPGGPDGPTATSRRPVWLPGARLTGYKWIPLPWTGLPSR